MSEITKGGIAAIFWGPHSPSTHAFAKKMDAQFHKIHYLAWKRPWLAPLKYILMWFKTWSILIQQRPDSVFVINTPVFAPLCVYLYCKVMRVPYVMNVHGHSFIGWKWTWAKPIQKFLAKRALINLVGFTEYEQLFQSWGAKTIILERPPITVDEEELENIANSDQFVVTLISTFSGDEPIDLVVQVGEMIPDVQFFILGDTKRADKTLLDSAPANVVFPGYLKADAYWNQLYSSNVIMTLTSTPLSMTSGGIEAMAVGKPMILSRQPVLVDYFTKGTIFVEHTVDSILDAVRDAQKNEEELAIASRALSVEKRARWEKAFAYLIGLMQDQNPESEDLHAVLRQETKFDKLDSKN